MSIDVYLDRTYRRTSYNCLHFCVEVWQDLTGEDISQFLANLLSGSIGSRKIDRQIVRSFEVLDKPESPCLVLFQVRRTAPHIGIWIRDRVLHLTEQGASHVPVEIASLGFTSYRYLKPCK